jgi:hypothetical protein
MIHEIYLRELIGLNGVPHRFRTSVSTCSWTCSYLQQNCHSVLLKRLLTDRYFLRHLTDTVGCCHRRHRSQRHVGRHPQHCAAYHRSQREHPGGASRSTPMEGVSRSTLTGVFSLLLSLSCTIKIEGAVYL